MIPLAAPNLGKLEQEYAAKAISDNYIGPDGKWVDTFEKIIAHITGRRYAVATITGTAALHVSAYVLGLKTYDTINHDYPAMNNIRRFMGWNGDVLDYSSLNHDFRYYGYGWPILCDRAPSLGVKQVDKISTIDCYSFAANKTVTCGQGGVVVMDDEGLCREIRIQIAQGAVRRGMFNYRMADINAAIGCAQLERLEEFLQKKQEIWDRYENAGFSMVNRGASRWMSTVKIDLQARHNLSENGIEWREEAEDSTSLPCGTGLTKEQQDKVIKTCEKYLP